MEHADFTVRGLGKTEGNVLSKALYFVAVASGCMIKSDVKCYLLYFINVRQIILIGKAAKKKKKKNSVSGSELPCFLLLVGGLQFKLFEDWKQNKSP